MKKTYDEIMKERVEQKQSTALATVETSAALSFVQQSRKELNELALSGNLQEALQQVHEVAPKMIQTLWVSHPGLSETNRQGLAVIKDELMHATSTIPNRRTDLEKRMSVLQTNRFTTAGAKYHQAKLEQAHHTHQYTEACVNLEVAKINFEKSLYKYNRLKNKILKAQEDGKDTFLMEKNLQLKGIALTKELLSLEGSQSNADNSAEELLEWSKIKEECYAEAQANNEFWSPDDINVGQMIPLAQRFFQNYLMAHQAGSEFGANTSDIINIDGLALTAMKEGQRDGTLGAMMAGLADSQIQAIWLGIYGKHVQVERQSEVIIFHIVNHDGSVEHLIYPVSMMKYNEIKALNLLAEKNA